MNGYDLKERLENRLRKERESIDSPTLKLIDSLPNDVLESDYLPDILSRHELETIGGKGIIAAKIVSEVRDYIRFDKEVEYKMEHEKFSPKERKERCEALLRGT